MSEYVYEYGKTKGKPVFDNGIIKEKNIFKIMNWINERRNYIKNYPNLNDEEKTEKIIEFSDAWLKHYRENKGFYNSDLYKQGVTFLGYERDNVTLNIDGSKVDITDIMHFGLLEGYESKTIKAFENCEIENLYKYWGLIKSLDSLIPEDFESFEGLIKKGNDLRQVIYKIIIACKRNYEVEYYKIPEKSGSLEINKETIESLYKEIEEKIKKDAFDKLIENLYMAIEEKRYKDAYKILVDSLFTAIKEKKYKDIFNILDIFYVDFGFELVKTGYKEFSEKIKNKKAKKTWELVEKEDIKEKELEKLFRYLHLNDKLEEYNIEKVWYDYRNQKESHIQKNFFYNLGFFLGLDIDCMESLFKVHGYSIKNSWEKKDLFLQAAINAGLDYDYISYLGGYLDQEAAAQWKPKNKSKNTVKKETKYYNISKRVFTNIRPDNYLLVVIKHENDISKKVEKNDGKEVKIPYTTDEYKKALDNSIFKLDSHISDFELGIKNKEGRYDIDIQAVQDELNALIKPYRKKQKEFIEEGKFDEAEKQETYINNLSEIPKSKIRRLKQSKEKFLKENDIERKVIKYKDIFGDISDGGDSIRKNNYFIKDRSILEWQILLEKLKSKLK